jgi:hypothetical protein
MEALVEDGTKLITSLDYIAAHGEDFLRYCPSPDIQEQQKLPGMR